MRVLASAAVEACSCACRSSPSLRALGKRRAVPSLDGFTRDLAPTGGSRRRAALVRSIERYYSTSPVTMSAISDASGSLAISPADPSSLSASSLFEDDTFEYEAQAQPSSEEHSAPAVESSSTAAQMLASILRRGDDDAVSRASDLLEELLALKAVLHPSDPVFLKAVGSSIQAKRGKDAIRWLEASPDYWSLPSSEETEDSPQVQAATWIDGAFQVLREVTIPKGIDALPSESSSGSQDDGGMALMQELFLLAVRKGYGVAVIPKNLPFLLKHRPSTYQAPSATLEATLEEQYEAKVPFSWRLWAESVRSLHVACEQAQAAGFISPFRLFSPDSRDNHAGDSEHLPATNSSSMKNDQEKPQSPSRLPFGISERSQQHLFNDLISGMITSRQFDDVLYWLRHTRPFEEPSNNSDAGQSLARRSSIKPEVWIRLLRTILSEITSETSQSSIAEEASGALDELKRLWAIRDTEASSYLVAPDRFEEVFAAQMDRTRSERVLGRAGGLKKDVVRCLKEGRLDAAKDLLLDASERRRLEDMSIKGLQGEQIGYALPALPEPNDIARLIAFYRRRAELEVRNGSPNFELDEAGQTTELLEKEFFEPLFTSLRRMKGGDFVINAAQFSALSMLGQHEKVIHFWLAKFAPFKGLGHAVFSGTRLVPGGDWLPEKRTASSGKRFAAHRAAVETVLTSAVALYGDDTRRVGQLYKSWTIALRKNLCLPRLPKIGTSGRDIHLMTVASQRASESPEPDESQGYTFPPSARPSAQAWIPFLRAFTNPALVSGIKNPGRKHWKALRERAYRRGEEFDVEPPPRVSKEDLLIPLQMINDMEHLKVTPSRSVWSLMMPYFIRWKGTAGWNAVKTITKRLGARPPFTRLCRANQTAEEALGVLSTCSDHAILDEWRHFQRHGPTLSTYIGLLTALMDVQEKYGGPMVHQALTVKTWMYEAAKVNEAIISRAKSAAASVLLDQGHAGVGSAQLRESAREKSLREAAALFEEINEDYIIADTVETTAPPQIDPGKRSDEDYVRFLQEPARPLFNLSDIESNPRVARTLQRLEEMVKIQRERKAEKEDTPGREVRREYSGPTRRDSRKASERRRFASQRNVTSDREA